MTYSLLMLLVLFLLIVLLKLIELRSDGGQTTTKRSALVKIVFAGLCCVVLAWIFSGYKGIPTSAIWVGAIMAGLSFLMSRTVFGRNAYLIGSNREAARLAGIDVQKHLLGGFVLMGFFYAIGGILMTARLSASTPALGQYLELDAIAAAVIGGISLRGGIGSVIGAVGGAILLASIDNGMSLLNISSFLQMVIKASLLLLALVTDTFYNARKG
ncbi:ABC transporter permease subunit [Rhizobium sp. Root1203]|uniref:ABC transporter permease subunit n=1 Tax=Rhizobium sp. Root1203 TaxID=1736427 RepID=UPI0023784F2C|nr:hypothetical protein [Rhizobium sp. Root1203]